VNHHNVEEVMNEPDAVMGTFSLNSFTTLVLFDTGASHSFISSAFVNKHDFTTKTIGKVIKVSSQGGELIVKDGCRNLILEIGKYKFVGVLDTGVYRSTCSWASSTAQLRPRGETMTGAIGKDPHEEAPHEENDDQNY
jgi:hypothetical protein